MDTQKRYQVFISSTFKDLKEERQAVYQTLLKMNCIPAGMELFPASDETQFDLIKRIIDTCDYYLLIIAGKYGSTATDGISFTEKEFDYAVQKGIPVIALLHRDPKTLRGDQIELSEEPRRRLEAFRTRVCTDRMVDYWQHAAELAGTTAVGMLNAREQFPRVGWVRGDQVANLEALTELNALRRENAELKAGLPAFRMPSDLADMDEEFELTGRYDDGPSWSHWSGSFTWAHLFSVIGLLAHRTPAEASIKQQLGWNLTRGSAFPNFDLDEFAFQRIKLQFIALDLISVTYVDARPIWRLTSRGEQRLLESNVVRTKKLKPPDAAP